MKLQLVTKIQAERLAKIGFDWEAFCFYKSDTEELREAGLNNWNKPIYNGCISAPTVALALKWIRDVKGIHNAVSFFDAVSPCYVGRYQVSKIIDVKDRILEPRKVYEAKDCKTYESAEGELLTELLNILDNEKIK
jgi:hypothetical protein